jgi:hypothetical protein
MVRPIRRIEDSVWRARHWSAAFILCIEELAHQGDSATGYLFKTKGFSEQ